MAKARMKIAAPTTNSSSRVLPNDDRNSGSRKIRPYGEGTIGIGFVDKTDVTLVAPGANLAGQATDFYDQTAAFTLGANAGVLIETGSRVGVYAQLGLRWVSGMAQIDDLATTGLGNINDKSSRWTMPIIAGIRFAF